MFATVRGFLNAVRRRAGMNAHRRLRPDLAAIAEMIPPGARVLDVGCGDGALLEHLVRTKDVDGRGIELSQQNVNACVARGLAGGAGRRRHRSRRISRARCSTS